MEQKYFTCNMTLLTPNHTFIECGGPKAFTSTAIFEKCVVRLAQEGRNTTF